MIFIRKAVYFLYKLFRAPNYPSRVHYKFNNNPFTYKNSQGINKLNFSLSLIFTGIYWLYYTQKAL